MDRPASRYRTGGALIMKVSGDAHERLSVADRSASPCGEFHPDSELADPQRTPQSESTGGDRALVVPAAGVLIHQHN